MLGIGLYPMSFIKTSPAPAAGMQILPPVVSIHWTAQAAVSLIMIISSELPTFAIALASIIRVPKTSPRGEIRQCTAVASARHLTGRIAAGLKP